MATAMETTSIGELDDVGPAGPRSSPAGRKRKRAAKDDEPLDPENEGDSPEEE